MFKRVSYWQRHVNSIIRYGTFRKYINFIKSYYFYLKGKAKISSLPSFLKIEISRFCDVNCKFCFVDKVDIMYPMHDYKKLIDQFKDYAFLVSLYDIGEPLHHPDVIECIRYAHTNKMGTVISTSLSINKDDAFWYELVTSGLDVLIVAIDGITAKSYNEYRRNGQFDLVILNLKKILELQKSTKSKIFIEWQMVDFEWNRSEQKAAEKMAYEFGCNNFRIIAEATQPRKCQDNDDAIRKRNCLLPYILFFVTAKNEVRLCYKIYHHDMHIGSLSHHSFAEIWNGAEIARVRDPEQIIHRVGCNKCRE
jgi:MoaA/NifB/PqqE/SkfB family radical SAM enzyme